MVMIATCCNHCHGNDCYHGNHCWLTIVIIAIMEMNASIVVDLYEKICEKCKKVLKNVFFTTTFKK